MSNKQHGLVHNLTATLLDENSQQAVLHAALQQLHKLFVSIGGVSGVEHSMEHDRPIRLAHGLAISPHMAASCSLHAQRTVTFLRGIHEAITEALNRFPDRPINILYAGCGPYATLLLPLTTCFTAQQIQIILLDIHTINIASVNKLIDAFNVSAYFARVEEADATTYQHPKTEPLHIIVTETMYRVLSQETQVAITQNLVPQLHVNGSFIPENISLSVCLSDPIVEDVMFLKRENEHGFSDALGQSALKTRVPIGRILDLNRETASGYFSPLQFTVPERPKSISQVLVLTNITVFKQHHLGCYDTPLTYPERVLPLNNIESGSTLKFWYRHNENPRLNYQAIGTNHKTSPVGQIP